MHHTPADLANIAAPADAQHVEDQLGAIAQCSICDADGWLWGAGDDGDPILCYHERELGADDPMTGTPPAELANVEPPADAQQVQPWVDETGNGRTLGRYVRGTRRATAGVEIVVAGWQSADGTVERHASAWATDVQLDAAALRQLAAAALDAADELDRHTAIAQCRACDRDGWLWGAGEDGDPIRCYHDDEQE